MDNQNNKNTCADSQSSTNQDPRIPSIIYSVLQYPPIPIESCGNCEKKCGIRRVSNLMCMCHPMINDSSGWNDAPFKVNITNKHTNLKLTKGFVCSIFNMIMQNLFYNSASLRDNNVKLAIIFPGYKNYGCGEELSFDIAVISSNDANEGEYPLVKIIEKPNDDTFAQADQVYKEICDQICEEVPPSIIYLEFVKALGTICNDLESGGIF